MKLDSTETRRGPARRPIASRTTSLEGKRGGEEHEAPAGAAPDSERAVADGPSDLAPFAGKHLRILRVKRGLSLERLAKASGVSRAMLGQIELQQSVPTINVLWKIARALDVPFSALLTECETRQTTVLRGANARILSSADGGFSSRALFPFDQPRSAEFYELRLAPHAKEDADPHLPGTVENLVVNSGALEIRVGGQRYSLGKDDSIQFQADVPHVYSNPGPREAVVYLVMTYAPTSA